MRNSEFCDAGKSINNITYRKQKTESKKAPFFVCFYFSNVSNKENVRIILTLVEICNKISSQQLERRIL